MLIRAKESRKKTPVAIERVDIGAIIAEIPTIAIENEFLRVSSDFDPSSILRESSFSLTLASPALRIFLNEHGVFLGDSGTQTRLNQRLIIEYEGEFYYSDFLTASDPILSQSSHSRRNFFTQTDKSIFILFELISNSTSLISSNYFYYAEQLDEDRILILNGRDFKISAQIFNLQTLTFSNSSFNLNLIPLVDQLNICLISTESFNFNFDFNFNYANSDGIIFRPFSKKINNLSSNYTLLSPI